HDAGEDQVADLEVHPHLLPTLDHQVAVGQHLRHHGGDGRLEAFLAVHRAVAGVLHARGEVHGVRRVDGAGGDIVNHGAEDAAHTGGVAGGAARLGGVVHLGAVIDGDDHGEDVADLVGAFILEEPL